MEILTFLTGIFGGLLANHLSPSFSRFMTNSFSRALGFLDRDAFDLSGTWQHAYIEAKPGSPEISHEETERLVLRHVGRNVTGKGQTKKVTRHFDYDLKLKHNMVFGTYTKVSDKGDITGNGLIQLLVSSDRQSMNGQAMWLDRDTDRIESAVIALKRIDGSSPI